MIIMETNHTQILMIIKGNTKRGIMVNHKERLATGPTTETTMPEIHIR
jgi:hypothetical protein